MSGSGGSGILIARKADGTWSPPSGILLHTSALAFVIGIDIYDCVLVINSVSTLEMFTRPRLTLGSEVDLAVGPLLSSGSAEEDLRWKELGNTVFTYLKARGQHQGVQLDGSLVTERGNENERFYGDRLSVLDIMAGNAIKSVPETRPLFEVIKAAEGRSDFDPVLMEILSQQPAPGDAIIETSNPSPMSPMRSPFGIPSADDPDPFGLIALEMAGLEIRESGSKPRPHSHQYDYGPIPTSPAFSKYSRQSVDTFLSRSNRGSVTSNRTQATAFTDLGTHADEPNSASETMFSSRCTEDGYDMTSDKLPTVMEPEEVDYTQIDSTALQYLKRRQSVASREAAPITNQRTSIEVANVASAVAEAPVQEPVIPDMDERDEDADDEDEDDEDFEEPVVYEVATAAQPARTAILSTQVTQVIQAKGALVTIPKRVPPPLPVRSPARVSRSSKSEYGDVSALKSPAEATFATMSVADDVPMEFETGHVMSTPEPAATLEDVAMVDSVPADELPTSPALTIGDGHWSVPSSRSPSTPQMGEMASSADEFDREPQTPIPEDDHHHSATTSPSSTEKAELTEDINIVSHVAQSNAIEVA
jgi:hypothetical protein